MSESNWKRQDYLEWSDYFMAVAFLSAQRSKDPNSQVGACIVSPERKIVGIGYNGMPNGCSDDLLPWRREAEDPLDTKYPYGKRAVHGVRVAWWVSPPNHCGTILDLDGETITNITL